MATRKINQMIETVRAQNQKDMEMLFKDVKFNNKLTDLRNTKKEEFQKRMEERESRFEEKQKLNNLLEQERLSKIREKHRLNDERKLQKQYNKILDNYYSVTLKHKSMLQDHEVRRLQYATELNAKLFNYVKKRENYLNDIRDRRLDHYDDVLAHLEKHREELKIGTKHLKETIDNERAEHYNNYLNYLKEKERNMKINSKIAFENGEDIRVKKRNFLMSNENALNDRAEDLRRGGVEELYYSDEILHKRTISPELFNKYRIQDNRINFAKSFLNEIYGIKRLRDDDLIEKEYQKFRKTNMREDQNEQRRKKQQNETVHKREIIENLIYNANNTLNKLKLDNLKTTKTYH